MRYVLIVLFLSLKVVAIDPVLEFHSLYSLGSLYPDVPQNLNISQSYLDQSMQTPSKTLSSQPMTQSEYRQLRQQADKFDHYCRSNYGMNTRSFENLMLKKPDVFVAELLNNPYLSDTAFIALWDIYKYRQGYDGRHKKKIAAQEQQVVDELQRRQNVELEIARVRKAAVVAHQKQLELQQKQKDELALSLFEQMLVQQQKEEKLFLGSMYEDAMVNGFDYQSPYQQQREEAVAQTKQCLFAQYDQSYRLAPQTEAFLRLHELDFGEYQNFHGTEFQHQLHREMHEFFDRAAQFQFELPCKSEMLHSGLLLINGAHDYNKLEIIESAIALTDTSFMWLDMVGVYGKAVVCGVAKSTESLVHSFVHPVQTIESLGTALCYVFETIALNNYCQEYGFEDLYIPLRDQRNAEIKAGLLALGQAFANSSGPQRVEALAQFAADFYVPGKIIHALGGALGVMQAATKVAPSIEVVAAAAGETNQAIRDIAQVALKSEQVVTEQIVQRMAQKGFRTIKKLKHPKKIAREVIEDSTGNPTPPRTLQKKAQSALNKAKNSKENKTRKLLDGRERYYTTERPSDTLGQTRGRSYVTEYDEKTNRIRQWQECYDHSGKVNRVRPTMINGREIVAQHYPATYQDIQKNLKGSRWRILDSNLDKN